MHDVRKLGLQVFAAPNNMTGQAQIQVKAREIDFVLPSERVCRPCWTLWGLPG